MKLNSERINSILLDASNIDGYIGIALADYTSGLVLGSHNSGPFNLELAAAGNSDVIRAKLKVIQSLDLNDTVEDMLITLGKHYHLIRLLPRSTGLMLYLALSRSRGNLALARNQLTQLEAKLTAAA